jgi:hypothetical protein
MRKTILLVIIPLVISFSASSQKFNAGIIAGGLVSQVDGDDHGGFNKFGILGGVFTSLQLSPRTSLQLEMEFIQKGSRYSDTINFNSYLLRYNYLEVPLLFQFHFAKRFSAEIGPAMDVLLSSYTEENGLETPEAPSSVQLRPVTLSGIFGVSGHITKHLTANFRFNYSLLSIREPVGGPYQDYRYILWQWGQFNNALSLSLLWYFKPLEL